MGVSLQYIITLYSMYYVVNHDVRDNFFTLVVVVYNNIYKKYKHLYMAAYV